MFSRWMFISEFSAWVSAIFNLGREKIFNLLGNVYQNRFVPNFCDDIGWMDSVLLEQKKQRKETFEAARRSAAGRFPLAGELFPRWPALWLKGYFLRQLITDFSSLSFFPFIIFSLSLHLKLLKIAPNNPQLFFQLADLLLLRLCALHGALVLGLEVGEPSKRWWQRWGERGRGVRLDDISQFIKSPAPWRADSRTLGLWTFKQILRDIWSSNIIKCPPQWRAGSETRGLRIFIR